MGDFKDYIISAILIGIFIFAFISFGIQFASENNLNTSIVNNEAINRSYVNIENELADIKTKSETQREGFFKDIPIIGDASLILTSIAGVTRVFFTSIRKVYNIVVTLIQETIGIPIIILNGFLAILLVSMVLLAWKFYKSGN